MDLNLVLAAAYAAFFAMVIFAKEIALLWFGFRLNRERGGGLDIVDALPGRPLLYVTPGWFILLLALGVRAEEAAVFAGGFLVWAWMGWHRWFQFNDIEHVNDRPPQWWESVIEFPFSFLTKGSVAWCWCCLTLRHAIFGTPWMAGLLWVTGDPLYAIAWAVFAPALSTIYWACRMFGLRYKIPVSEAVSGMGFGVLAFPLL